MTLFERCVLVLLIIIVERLSYNSSWSQDHIHALNIIKDRLKETGNHNV